MHRKLFAVLALSLSLLLSGCAVFPPVGPIVPTTQEVEVVELPCDIDAIDRLNQMYMGPIDFSIEPDDWAVTMFVDEYTGMTIADVELLVDAAVIEDFVDVARLVTNQTVFYDYIGDSAIVTQSTARSMIDSALYDDIVKELSGVCSATWYITTYLASEQLPTPPCTEESCKEVNV